METFLLTNARIYTMDKDQPKADSLAVGLPTPDKPNDGRILAVGEAEALRDKYLA